MLFTLITTLILFSAIIASAQTIEEKIIYFAEKQGVDPTLAVAIARCESGLQEKAKNPNSSASSIFQFVKSTWKSTTKRMGWIEGTDVFDPHLNVVAGIWLLKTDGVIHWKSSEDCWSKMI